MNAFDYFFEHTSGLDKQFLVGEQETTYKDLYLRSALLSYQIKQQIGERQRILLLSPNNAFFLTVYLAVLKSGNTVVPLDPMIETDHFKYIYNLTRPRLLFTVPHVITRLSLDRSACTTPQDINITCNITLSDPGPSLGDHELAEIIFTSGSTGKPKGVMLSHKNLVANTHSIVKYLQLNATDRMLVVLPFFYCYGLSLLHTHLRVGGSLVFNNAFMYLGAVVEDLAKYKCTGFAGVPSHFQFLLRKSDSFKSTTFSHLHYVTQAGGKLANVFIDEFREAHPSVKFIVMYGQTEATARLSYLPANQYESHKGSVGKGIPGVTLRVVSNDGHNVRPGDTGEIIAKGDNIMLGYYMDNDETAKVIKNGWLYTGDLGTVDEDGFIYLTARAKEIIKVGGRRISPKEIEAVILSLPGVVDCTVEGVQDALLGEALKASVVVNGKDSGLDEERLKRHCRGSLELYKIPRIIQIRDKATMTATGKKIKR